MAFDSLHRVWSHLFDFGGKRNSVPFPPTPTVPSAVIVTGGIQLSWSDLHAYKYRIYRDGQLLSAISGLSYLDAGVSPGTHSYTISVGLADNLTWGQQSAAAIISFSSSTLVFSQPPNFSYTFGSLSLDLSQFVSGGNPTKWYFKAAGAFPKYTNLSTSTGVVSGTLAEVGTFTPTIRVVDTIAEALEEDWRARSTGPGVQWAHDFRDASTVSKFRINGSLGAQVDGSGNTLVRHLPGGGIKSNGCLELFTPQGVQNKMRWARPFCALPGDIGYTSGAALIPNWEPRWDQFRRGMYGHPDYWGQSGDGVPLSGGGSDGYSWDGHDFYIQFRVKTSAAAYSPSHPVNYGGKMAYVEPGGGGNQELILTYGRRLGLYTNFGDTGTSTPPYNTWGGQNPLHDPQGTAYQTTSLMQPNTPYADSYNNGFANCWSYPDDEWVTVLLHVIPGHHNGNNDRPNMNATDVRKDTGIEVWVARQNTTTYTKVWEKFDYVWNYYSNPTPGNLYGFNELLFTQYMNGDSAGVDWARWYDEVIFSTRPIACQQVALP